jgi:hypothetical protein
VFENLPADRRFTIIEPVEAERAHTVEAGSSAVQFVEEVVPPATVLRLPTKTLQPARGSSQLLLPIAPTRIHVPAIIGDIDADGTAEELPETREHARGVYAIVDFDRDGRLDVFAGGRIKPGQYPLAPPSELFARRESGFEDVTDEIAPALREVGMVTAALWTDVDDDGWLDLLVALEWGGVKYFRNERGRAFEDRSEAAGFAAAGTSWWSSLAAADFNRDGRLDYVAGNVGLNTPYDASAERPALIFHGDFRGDGRGAQLIEACYEGERLVPRRARNELAAHIPAIARRFPKTNDYARATLEEIVGADRLSAARRFAATELRSGVFLSQPDGTWLFSPLPRIAQIAPFRGTVAGDFDGDGNADIFASQNSFAPISSLGRFDGGVGQLLRGDGRGGFSAVPPHESGIILTGDGAALAVADVNGDSWPDFVACSPDGDLRAWRNLGVADRAFLRVTLRGPAGNPRAIGARVTMMPADGPAQIAETASGAGWVRPAEASLFFGYSPENPPQRVRVRWPSGTATEHDVAPGTRSVLLDP